MREILAISPPAGLVVSAGTAPILQWIKIAELVIDDSYQRDLRRENWSAIRRIAENFRWSRFSPVFVSPVEGGRFAVIDGQHRTHAAAMCGFEQVPCQIVPMTREEQAASFAAVNGMVTKVTSIQLFKARVREGDPKAQTAVEIAEAAGCKICTSNPSSKLRQPGDIAAPKMFLSVIEQRGPDAVKIALTALRKADGYSDVKEVWDASILEPLLLAMTSDKDIVASTDLISVLERMPLWDMAEEVHGEIKRRLRLGLPYAGKKPMLRQAFENYLGTYIKRSAAGGAR